MLNVTPARARVLVFACVAALVGCATVPGTSPAARSTAPLPMPVDAESAATSLSHTLTVDVDPIHGAAFERPVRQLQTITLEKTLRLLVEFPQVQHNPATGRTTVTMQLTNAGDSLNFLACRVGGEKKIVSPAYQWNTTVAKTGQTQSQTLVFENPGGGGFAIDLTFLGILAGTPTLHPGDGSATSAPSPVASASPTAEPTTLPTATPTTVPTATPTPIPTAVPTASPNAAGWVATASSIYGGTPPSRTIDGDLATQWANDGYRAASAWLAVDTGAVRPLSSVGLKMVPQNGGGSYVIEVSDDGTTWRPVTDALRNSSYNVEVKPLPAGTTGRHVRVHFTNSATAPETRFSIYELTLNGAGSPVTATPSPTPTAAPTSPPGSGSLLRTFDSDALNSDPADFIDPIDEGWSESWLPRVNWKIVERDGSKQYMHNGLSNTANLSFRRYRGTGLNTTNGLLPAKYFAEVNVTPIQSYTYAPTGDQGTQVYYLDPKNYLELLVKPTMLEVWTATNAEPFGNSGWSRLYYQNVSTKAGQTRKLGAEVDGRTGNVKVYFDGEYATTVHSGLVTDRPHWFAMRGTGNIVTHDNVKLDPR